MLSFWILLVLNFLFLFFLQVNSSFGDQDINFAFCVRNCYHECRINPKYEHILSKSSIRGISLVTWDSFDLCNHHCMLLVTKSRIENNLPAFKYFGHWPFIRWFGLEEPASVLFSVLNLFPHLIKFLTSIYYLLTGKYKTNNHFMSIWIDIYAIVSINAWIASAIYHSKKTIWSINYDLISALLLVLIGMALSIHRVLISFNCNIKVIYFVNISIFAFFLIRVYFMLFSYEGVSFDLHMKTCISVVVGTTLLWLIWIFSDFYYQNPILRDYNKRICLIVQIWFILAAMLEIFDFPPIYLTFDAHSLWHASTILLGFLWYYFWESDHLQNIKHLKN